MNIFTRDGRALLLLTAAVGAVFTSGAFAQEDTALVPFVVNVDATVRAEPPASIASGAGAVPVQISVTGGEEAILRLPLSFTSGVARFGAQRHGVNAAAVVNRGGKIAVNLPAETYKSAEVSLYTVNGKRVFRRNVSGLNVSNNVISRRNVATGAYLLTVKGMDGNAVTSRFTHGGGALDISVSFGGVGESVGNTVSAPGLSRKAAGGPCAIKVSASGYVDSVYTLLLEGGMNPRQTITLRAVPTGGGGSYESVTLGGKKWMKKNLNVETEDSWCYENSADSCAKYGRLYTWESAKAACQSVGWRLPDTADWRRLVEAAGGAATAGSKLKSTSGWYSNGNGTDEFGFSALPGGGRLSGGSSFNIVGYSGDWWTATEDSGGRAYRRRMLYYSDYVYESNYDEGDGFSVRCVED